MSDIGNLPLIMTKAEVWAWGGAWALLALLLLALQ